jgi:hypothetical protein
MIKYQVKLPVPEISHKEARESEDDDKCDSDHRHVTMKEIKYCVSNVENMLHVGYLGTCEIKV